MSVFPNYRRATNAAYDALIACKCFVPPIDIFRLVKQYSNLIIMSYADASTKYKKPRCTFGAASDYGFTIKNLNGTFLVLYNEMKSHEVVRFTLAHELGHIVLEHNADSETANRETNCFARNILCPIPLVHEGGVKGWSAYVSVFDVSEPMAVATASMAQIDFYHISDSNYKSMRSHYAAYLYGFTPAYISDNRYADIAF